MAPFSLVKVSQLNLIDLVTKVVDLGVPISTITYTVENRNLYLHVNSPDGTWLERTDGASHNRVVADGLTMMEYVHFSSSSQPTIMGTHSVLRECLGEHTGKALVQARILAVPLAPVSEAHLVIAAAAICIIQFEGMRKVKWVVPVFRGNMFRVMNTFPCVLGPFGQQRGRTSLLRIVGNTAQPCHFRGRFFGVNCLKRPS